MTWREAVNQPKGVERMADVNAYVTSSLGASQAPIDVFYNQSKDIVRAGTPELLRAHPALGPLLLVGLVSATENYFRDIFARVLQMCPVARASAADHTIKIGSVVWHGINDLERGAFEHMSFADAKGIMEASRKYIGHVMRRNTVLEEFDKVCQLRHSIVHASSHIAGNNAVKLQISRTGTPLRVRIGFGELQEAGAICASLVAAANLELFSELARRWAVVWPTLPSWEESARHETFKRIWNGFYSVTDAANGATPVQLTLVKCRNRVASEFS